MRLSLNTRNLLSVTLVTLVICVCLGLFFLTQLSILEVQQAQDDAEGVSRQFMNLGNIRLSERESPASLGVLAEDPVIEAFLRDLPAASPYVVYAALLAADGSTVISSGEGLDDGLETRDLRRLTEMNAVARVFSLLDHGQMFASTTPLMEGEQEVGQLVLLIDTSLVRDRLRSVLLDSRWIILLALAIAWLAAISTALLTRRLMQRVQLQIEKLREGDFDFEPGPIRDAGFDRLASQLRDLGQAFKSERISLLAEKRSFEEILHHIQMGVMLLDEDDRILFYNAPLRPLIGDRLKDAAGARIDNYLDNDHPLQRILRRARRDKQQNLEGVRVGLPAAGRFQETLVSVFSLEVSGDPRGSVFLLEDLTGYKALMTLVDYGAQVGEISRYASGIVHDVKNPLGIMLSHVEVIRLRAPDDPRLSASLNAIEKAIEELDSLVEGLLDFLKQQPLQVSRIDLAEVIESVAEFYRPDVENHGVEMSLDIHRSPCFIKGETKRLRQVLTNLISNAVDAMPDGGKLEIRTSDVGSETIAMDVRDTGSGIDPSEQTEIFKIYHTSKPDGRGIGLAVVHRIVEEHGGTIRVESEPGEGSTFRVELPAAEPGSGPDAPTEEPT